MRRKVLLGCGVATAAWWVGMDVVGSLRYAGYSYRDQTISELSAEGAPTRAFMTLGSGIPYAVLMAAFGVGVWRATGPSRAGRITGALLAGEAVWGFVGGLLFPMARREVLAADGETLRNSLHMPYGAGMAVFFLLAVGTGSGLLGRRFRYFSYGSVLAMLVFGFLMGLQNGQLAANEPTPWMGVEERVNAYAAMLWVAALAVGLLRAEATEVPRRLERATATPLTMQRLPR